MSQKFLNRILEEVFDNAHAPESGRIRLTAMTEVLLSYLEDAGVVTTPETAYYRLERGNVAAAEVHGYACDTEDDVIMLFFCVDATTETPLGQPATVSSTGKELLDRAFRRLESFVKLARAGRIDDVDDSQPVHELIELLKDAGGDRRAIELYVLTTGVVSDRASAAGASGALRREIWDLVRLERICGGEGDGAITIDFVRDFGTTIPALVTAEASDGLQVLLTCLPGQLLADIYNTHRAALLERNVRSFLQFTGKVNKGIRATVLNEPHRFLPYNNGLSATAGEVVLGTITGDLAEIRVIRDFQIVNGGQTTATIASCARRDRADLGAVTVPMKLTIVPKNMLDSLVPQISRYANTQNRIQDSDFSANDPWHIALERLSRSTWTRATPESQRGTRWFYERSRGQYADAVSSNPTPAGRRLFRNENPPSQKFTKTDLAKFVLSWNQYPSVVSKGAQKCFMTFMSQLAASQRKTPDEVDFRRIIALGILFHTAERLYGDMGFQGFRAQAVTYSIARLSHECQRYLDVETIWREQAIPEVLVNALKIIIAGVRDVITHPPAAQRNESEWCKRDECWTAVLGRPIQTELPKVSTTQVPAAQAMPAQPLTNGERQTVDAVRLIPAEAWFAAAAWAKNTSTLAPWQRSLAYSLGRLTESQKVPTVKQAVQGRRLMLEALRLGFAHESLGNENIAMLDGLPNSEH